MATDPQTLLTEAQCYQCYTPGEWQLMILALLRQIVLEADPMADVSPNALLEQAKCYDCYGGGGMWTLMMLALLAQISQAGGGGSVDACLVAQSGAPVAPCAFAFGLAYDNDANSPTAGSFWFWDATGSAWVRFSV